MKKRVFISFTFPFDIEARNRLVSRSLKADAGFSVSGWSVRPSALRQDWEEETRKQIEEADVMVALVSAHTRSGAVVGHEVSIAREMGKPLIAVQSDEAPSPPDNVSELVRPDELPALLESLCK